MRKLIRNISCVLLFALGFNAKAQQLPLYSQYMTNQYVINPAYTGTKDHFVAVSNYRYQWVGITDAPRTYILSVHGPHKYKNYGIGGALYTDVTGPTSRTGIYLSYAYRLKMPNRTTVSLGLSGGLLQYKVDGTKITLLDPGDLALTNSLLTAMVPDFGFGAYWYGDNFYVGASVPQFIQTRIQLFNNETKSLSKLKSHMFFNGGYKFEINYDYAIEPSVLIKYTYPVTPQFDLGVRLFYQDYIWLGAVFRTQDAFSALVGYRTPDQRFSFAYSYDITHSDLRKYNTGTHEITIIARFKKFTKKRKKRKLSKLEKLQRQLQELEKEEQELEGIGTEDDTKDESTDGDMDEYKPDDQNDVNDDNVDEQPQKSLEQQMLELEQNDKELRAKVRSLRQEAKDQGFDSPNDPNFPKRDEYIKTLDEIKSIYKKKKEIDSQLD